MLQELSVTTLALVVAEVQVHNLKFQTTSINTDYKLNINDCVVRKKKGSLREQLPKNEIL